jgi:transcriptional regulator with XRE-family HTH domain
MNYGERIAELRERNGLTQGKLSSRLGISRASLSHYETNRREPDFETLTALADLFQVSVDYLIGRTNNPRATLTEEVSHFVDKLELSDEAILDKFDFTIDGRVLTPEEARRFISFIRNERSKST